MPRCGGFTRPLRTIARPDAAVPKVFIATPAVGQGGPAAAFRADISRVREANLTHAPSPAASRATSLKSTPGCLAAESLDEASVRAGPRSASRRRAMRHGTPPDRLEVVSDLTKAEPANIVDRRH